MNATYHPEDHMPEGPAGPPIDMEGDDNCCEQQESSVLVTGTDLEVYSDEKQSENVLTTPAASASLRQLITRIGKGHLEVQRSLKSSVLHAKTVGQDLVALKKLTGHGQFGTALGKLKAKYGIAERTANLYMQIANKWDSIEAFLGSQELSTLTLRDIQRHLNRGALFSHESAEWLTPPEIITATLACFASSRGITLDPAAETSTDGRFNIPADLHYTKEIDGLSKANEWLGSVYLNPPYGAREMEHWIERLSEEFFSEAIAEAIVLIPARTDTACFRRLVTLPTVFVFVSGRLHFSGHKSGAPFPSLIAYVGHNHEPFVEAFCDIGPILYPALKGAEAITSVKEPRF